MSQRRRLRDETMDEFGGGGFNSRPEKMPRRNERYEVMSRIKELLVKLSDHKRETLHSRIEDLSYLVCDALPNYKMEILNILADCVALHPMQSGAYATFLGLVNARNYEFGGESIIFLLQQLLKSLLDAEWMHAKGFMMLLADLVNVNLVTVASILQLLNSLTSVCEEEASPQTRRDFYAYLVIITLPLIGRELYEKREQALQALIKRLQLYMNKDRCSGESVRMMRIWSNGEMPQHEYMELLWQQTMRLDRNNWIETHLLRPYLAFDNVLSSALQHQLPVLMPPEYDPAGVPYPRSWLVFHMFEMSFAPLNLRLPEELDIERHLIEMRIMEILQVHHLERKTCAEFLLAFILSKPELSLDNCIVEVILGQMLQLPSSPYLTINYGSILIEMCKMRPSEFPQVVAQAADILFTQLEFMNVSSFDRFVNWFSHHLSNFRYQWSWQDWECCTVVPPLHPSSMFVRELLKKCMRLSYHRHIVQLVPASYQPLCPPEPNPTFKYINQLLPGAMLAKQLLDAIRKKASPLVVGGFIEATVNLDESTKVNVMMQTLLHLGCKTFTHVFTMLNKYQPVLKMLGHNSANQLRMLEALAEVWANSEQQQFVIAESLLKMHIVDANIIVSWIFGQEQKLMYMYLWELLNAVIKYTKNQSKYDNVEHSWHLLQCLLLNIVQMCVNAVFKHEQSFESKEADYWSDWVVGRLQSVFFNYIDDFRPITSKLREIATEVGCSMRLVNLIESFLSYIHEGSY